MVSSACIGFCRSSDNKKLGEIVDDYLSGKKSEQELKNYCKKVRLENVKTQKDIGIDIIPSNDFSMYDSMLDATCLVGNIQKRYYWEGGKVPLQIYFSLAKGMQKDKFDVVPLKLQNWLNTNYLYHVPEFTFPIEFVYSDNKPVVEYLDAKYAGIETRSVVIAPITYLLQGKLLERDIELYELIEEILPVYKELFINYKRVGVKSVQLEDPMICVAIDNELKEHYRYCYNKLREYAGSDLKLDLVSYYGSLRDNFNFIRQLPVDSIHIDYFYNKEYIDDYINDVDKSLKLSLGLVDARNIWKNDLNKSIEIASKFCDKIGSENVIIANSSPLFLCPYSVELEYNLPDALKKQLSFGVEKLHEIEIIKKVINTGDKSVKQQLNESKKMFSKKLYKSDIGKVENIKEVKRDNKWTDFCKKNQIKNNSMMFLGNADINVQNRQEIDIVSFGLAKKSYDISDYQASTKGIKVLENNMIPRFGTDYYNPTIIYDDVVIKNDIFVKNIKDIKKSIKKPLKFNICSPVHFINFSFVSPFIDTEEIYKNLVINLSKCVQNIAKDVDILQINELTFTTGVSLNNLKNPDKIDCVCKHLDYFISLIKDVNYIAVCNSFGNVSDVIERICNINADMVLFSSVRSGYDILNTLTKYKPNIPIGLGLMDLYSSRVTTKNEILTILKRIFSLLDNDSVVFTTDGEMRNSKDATNISKSLENINSSILFTIKEITKKKHPENSKKNKKKNQKD